MASSAISVDTASALGLAGADVIGGLVGQRLGRYEVIGFMGRGGMADVYAAKKHGAGGRAALKRMLPRLTNRPELVELFLHEARIHSLLEHENLVRCIDFDASNGVPFLVLELVDGVGCDSVLRWTDRAVPVPFALAIARGVLSALAFAHDAVDTSGVPLDIVHHDVSLDNVLVTTQGGVKLLDFGVAHSKLSPERAVPCELRGKLCYMAPEQIAGLPTDRRSDLFSAAVVLAELVLGRHLFSARDELRLLVKTYEVDLEVLRESAATLPDALVEMLFRALSRTPERRFQTAREFLAALDNVADSMGGLPGPADLANWLRSQNLLGSSRISFHDAPILYIPTGPVADKIEAARPALSSLSSESRRAPTPSIRGMAAVINPADRYALRDSKGELLRDLTFADVLERLVTGRAGYDTPISDDGRLFRRVGDLPSFAFVAATPACRFDDRLEQRADWTAPLRRRELPSLLFSIAAARATGALSLWVGSRKKRIYFTDGEPVFVASTDPSELFGARLVANRIISRELLQSLLALATRQRRHLGEAIVAARHASSGEVLRLLVSQLERRLLEVGCWTTGQIAFTHGARAGLSCPRPMVPAASHACELVRTAYVDGEIESFLAGVEGFPVSRSPQPKTATVAVPLTAVEAEILERSVGSHDAARIPEALAEQDVASPAVVRRALFLGLSAGLIVSPGWESAVGIGVGAAR